MTSVSEILIKILFVLILGTASLTIMQKTLSTLFSIYGLQSFLIAMVSLILYMETGSTVLLVLTVLTVITKVILIPYMLNKIRVSSASKRDAEFRYLTPVSSMLIGVGLIVVVYSTFSRINLLSQDTLFFLGAVVGVSLSLMGMLVIFNRKKVVTKVVGYLIMENGILLFGLFVAELPMIIELLIIVDLIIFIMLATVLAFGIDSTEDAFRIKLNDMFARWFKK